MNQPRSRLAKHTQMSEPGLGPRNWRHYLGRLQSLFRQKRRSTALVFTTVGSKPVLASVLNIIPLALNMAVRAARHTTYHTWHFLPHCLARML